MEEESNQHIHIEMEERAYTSGECKKQQITTKIVTDKKQLHLFIGCYDERVIHLAFEALRQLHDCISATTEDMDVIVNYLGDNSYRNSGNSTRKKLFESLIDPAKKGLDLKEEDKLSSSIISQVRLLLGNHEWSATRASGVNRKKAHTQGQRYKRKAKKVFEQQGFKEDSHALQTQGFSSELVTHRESGINEHVISYDTTRLYERNQATRHARAIFEVISNQEIDITKLRPLLLGHHNPGLPTDNKVEKTEPFYPMDTNQHQYARIQDYHKEVQRLVKSIYQKEVLRPIVFEIETLKRRLDKLFKEEISEEVLGDTELEKLSSEKELELESLKKALEYRLTLYNLRRIAVCAHTHTASVQLTGSHGATIIAPTFSPSNLDTIGFPSAVHLLFNDPNHPGHSIIFRMQYNYIDGTQSWEKFGLSLPNTTRETIKLVPVNYETSSLETLPYQPYNPLLQKLFHQCHLQENATHTVESFIFLIELWITHNTLKSTRQIIQDLKNIRDKDATVDIKIQDVRDAINKILGYYFKEGKLDRAGKRRLYRYVLHESLDILNTLHTIRHLISIPTGSQIYVGTERSNRSLRLIKQMHDYYQRITTDHPEHTLRLPLPPPLTEPFSLTASNTRISNQDDTDTVGRLFFGHKSRSPYLIAYNSAISAGVFLLNFPHIIWGCIHFATKQVLHCKETEHYALSSDHQASNNSSRYNPLVLSSPRIAWHLWTTEDTFIAPWFKPNEQNHTRRWFLMILRYISLMASLISSAKTGVILTNPYNTNKTTSINQSQKFLTGDNHELTFIISFATLLILCLTITVEKSSSIIKNMFNAVKLIEPVLYANLIYKIFIQENTSMSADSYQIITGLTFAAQARTFHISRQHAITNTFLWPQKVYTVRTGRSHNKGLCRIISYNLFHFLTQELIMGLTAITFSLTQLSNKNPLSQLTLYSTFLILISTIIGLTSSYFNHRFSEKQNFNNRLIKGFFTESYFNYWKMHIFIENLLSFFSDNVSQAVTVMLSLLIIYMQAQLNTDKPEILSEVEKTINKIVKNNSGHISPRQTGNRQENLFSTGQENEENEDNAGISNRTDYHYVQIQ